MLKEDITLAKLRDLAAELGMELIYMKKGSHSEFDRVETINFDRKKSMGLAQDGKVEIKPLTISGLFSRLSLAVRRKKQIQHIESLQ